jgi:ribosomal protein L7/L12
MNRDFEAKLRSLLADGQKIEAIKRYREQFGVGLKEAKEAVEALERGEALPRIERKVSANLDDEVASLMEQGRKIEAIKLYREHARSGLKEAKDAVEAIAAARGITSKSGCLGVVLLVFLVLLGQAGI